MAVSIW
ncbi:hypothetical protein F383_22246 [Gossypium arboreum]|nr:hypothetical protein F383_22246 [Gossypium arboreum]